MRHSKIIGWPILILLLTSAKITSSQISLSAIEIQPENFEPRRVLSVVPDPANSSVPGAMTLNDALQTVEPGDLVTLYAGAYQGHWRLRRSGQPDAPIVFRAAPGNHAQIVGNVRMEANDNWLWGLDITDPNNVALGDGVEVRGSGIYLINNVIHDHCNDNGIGAWNTGRDQRYYGNILYHNGCNPQYDPKKQRVIHPHNVYTQNSYDANGIKLFDGNLILDEGCSNGCTSFAAYTEAGAISGYLIKDNIFANGRVLHGGFKTADNVFYQDNLFFNANLQFGYRRPVQVTFAGNYVAQSEINASWFWSQDGQKQGSNEVTDNTFVDVNLQFRTAGVNLKSAPPIDSADRWDENVIVGPFEGGFSSAGLESQFHDLSEWQQLTAEAGNPFDRDSLYNDYVSQPHIVLVHNQYDPARLYIAVVNWSNAASVDIDLPGTSLVYDAYSLYQKPVAVGVNHVQLPLRGSLSVFVACVGSPDSKDITGCS